MLPKIEKNCPFCGSDKLYAGPVTYDNCTVLCENCGSQGPDQRWDHYFGSPGSGREECFSKHHKAQIRKVEKERGFKAYHKREGSMRDPYFTAIAIYLTRKAIKDWNSRKEAV
jgi:hypothetical protein